VEETTVLFYKRFVHIPLVWAIAVTACPDQFTSTSPSFER